MKNRPLDFQIATANHVLDAFRNGQRRVLVADEAGLGKTTVASEVVRQVRYLEGVLDDEIYCIVYVCCNLQIAQQNIDTLSDEGEAVDLAQSRLSMQHYVYYRKKTDLLKDGRDTLVLSLTPATSFQMTFGTGSADERALIYACLSMLPDFEDEGRRDELSRMMQRDAYKGWVWYKNRYIELVNAPDMDEYRKIIKKAMQAHIDTAYKDTTIKAELMRLTSGEEVENRSSAGYWLIVALRKMFASISLEVLKPDLVIMDEFQKFSSLIVSSQDESHDSEENMVARKFFANKETFILLLSATPYKPYTTIEELNENNNDEQYKDFHRLLNFLYENSEAAPDIKIIWQNYSSALSHLGKTDFTVLLDKHEAAESMLYHVMGRTERQNTGIIKEVMPDISHCLTEGDIRSYIQMQHLIDNCRCYGQRVFSAPTDYTKSAAFQLSFMDYYKLKDEIQKGWAAGARKKSNVDCLLLDKNAIEDYKLAQYNNARLNFVIESIFGNKQHPTYVEQLLWVPTSHPYYATGESIFTRNKDFSKYLVFSSWGMVPKMLASLISYEAERRLYRRAYKGAVYSDDVKVLLKDDNRTKGSAILNTVSTYLAGLYNPERDFGKSLSDIKKSIKEEIEEKLNGIEGERTNRISSVDIFQLMQALDNSRNSVDRIYTDSADVLAEIAIASPASCLYRAMGRIAKNDDMGNVKLLAEDAAKELVGIFNNRYGIAAVKLTCRSNEEYFLRVLDYCALGNLQATIDEYVHMISERKPLVQIKDRIKESLVSAFRQPVGTIQGFTKDDKYSMRKHFAVDFGNTKQTEQAVTHATSVRSAFNSPFRPFVLASTSIGQEGLDFHWYCRKMIHWNLPSNPQNLEQREGRINRYKCLSVRRNVAKVFGEKFSWKEMFEEANQVLKQDNPEMVPYWFLPLNNEVFEGRNDLEYIERIIPIYPMSEENGRYRRLIDVLSLYRLTMGQPRQEELLQMLAGKVSKEDVQKLLFDLSPYNRNKKYFPVKYYHGEKESPFPKEDIKDHFWYGEMMFVTTGQDVEHWKNEAKGWLNMNNENIQQLVSKYSPEQLGVIAYISALYGKWSPYDDQSWLIEY